MLATVVIALLTIPLLAVVLFATASPVEMLVALTALALAVVLLFRIELALLVLIAAGSLEEAFALSSNPQLTMTKVAGAICFASFARYALTSRRPLLFDRSHAVVIGILLIALASTVQAFDTSIAVTTTTRYASFVALYVIVSQFVGAHRLQRQIAWVLTLTAAVAAIIALRSYFTGETVVATLPEANPSDFAFILATTLPLSFWLLEDAPRWRVPLFAAIGLIASAIVLSLSRGTMVGLAAGLAWMVLVDRRHVRLVLVGGVLALAVALLVIRSDPSRFETALLYKQKVADYNVTTRYDAWNAAAELAVENPVLGVGPGNFRFYYNEQTGRPVGDAQPLRRPQRLSRCCGGARHPRDDPLPGLPRDDDEQADGGSPPRLRLTGLCARVAGLAPGRDRVRHLRLGAVLRSVLAARRPGHGRLGRRRTRAAAGLTCASSTSPA